MENGQKLGKNWQRDQQSTQKSNSMEIKFKHN